MTSSSRPDRVRRVSSRSFARSRCSDLVSDPDQHLSFAAKEAEPQKLPLNSSCHRTLLLVHPQLQLLLQKLTHAAHHPLTRPLCLDVDVAIVCVADEPVPSPLQLLVQVIQHDVGQQWRERSALRRPLLCLHHHPIHHHPGLEIPPDQLQHLSCLSPPVPRAPSACRG